MKLEQNEEQTLMQVLCQKIIQRICIFVLVVTSIFVFSTPIKNFIRTYKPLPTAELRKH